MIYERPLALNKMLLMEKYTPYFKTGPLILTLFLKL